ncbi:hypothetical protein BD779DRAFT_435746 [Infundibulicybe gibba]|nr:hypothetical protein BD779DRAFT_435746 [Infundibulicybe gibba]
MAKFLDLPLDLLPAILSHLVKPHHLTQACTVNRAFYGYSAPLLYERVFVYAWQKEGKTRVVQLFTTLSQQPRLAQFVRRLEIRDFPKAFTPTGSGRWDIVLEGLRNCVNLRACTWTRDGSLKSWILEALQSAKFLEELEINGNSARNYDPELLLGFTQLKKLSLIMPSASVGAILRPWFLLAGSALLNLTIICKSSPVITDDLLISVGPELKHLIELRLVGCPKVTYRGVSVILSNSSAGLGVSAWRVSLQDLFIHFCESSGSLNSLHSITLTNSGHEERSNPQAWIQDISQLIYSSPIEILQIYSTSLRQPMTSIPLTTWLNLLSPHVESLKRFSVHRMTVAPDVVQAICNRCIYLEQLFVAIEQRHMKNIGQCISGARRLRTLHINSPIAETELSSAFVTSRALVTVNHLSTTVTQFGWNARVWQVDWVFVGSDEGRIISRPVLSKYERPDIPEQFLVVHT